MMRYYYVKSDLFGIPRGCVERFADHKAGALVQAGQIELYDENKHKDKPGAKDARAHLRAIREHEGSGRR